MTAAATTEDIPALMRRIGAAARAAAGELAMAPREAKDTALRVAAEALRGGQNAILDANAKDMAIGEEKGLSGAMLDPPETRCRAPRRHRDGARGDRRSG